MRTKRTVQNFAEEALPTQLRTLNIENSAELAGSKLNYYLYGTAAILHG